MAVDKTLARQHFTKQKVVTHYFHSSRCDREYAIEMPPKLERDCRKPSSQKRQRINLNYANVFLGFSLYVIGSDFIRSIDIWTLCVSSLVYCQMLRRKREKNCQNKCDSVFYLVCVEHQWICTVRSAHIEQKIHVATSDLFIRHPFILVACALISKCCGFVGITLWQCDRIGFKTFYCANSRWYR